LSHHFPIADAVPQLRARSTAHFIVAQLTGPARSHLGPDDEVLIIACCLLPVFITQFSVSVEQLAEAVRMVKHKNT
jgi:hypothetical protein